MNKWLTPLEHPIDINITRRLHRRLLRLPTRRKWAQSRYLGTTAQAGVDADISLP